MESRTVRRVKARLFDALTAVSPASRAYSFKVDDDDDGHRVDLEPDYITS
jgi:hypothetical protein